MLCDLPNFPFVFLIQRTLEPHSISVEDDLNEAAKQVEVRSIYFSFLFPLLNQVIPLFVFLSAELTLGWDENQDGGYAES